MRAGRVRVRAVLALWVAVALLTTAGAAYGQLGALFGFTEEQELELGRQASVQIEQKLTLLEDPNVVRYVDDLGRKLVAVSGRSDIPYTFKVVDGKEVNAFALPGGYVYVFRGLIQAADYESELAGVMAHELGHVVARHGLEQLKRAQLIGLGAAVFGQILGGGREAGQGPSVAELAINLVGTGAYLSYSREAEAEADRLGVRILYDAGYEPSSFVTFLEKLESRQGRDPTGIGAFFSTHPSPAQRRANVGSLIAQLPSRDDAVRDSRRFQLVKQLLGGLAPPREGPVPAAPTRPGRLVRVGSYKAPPGEVGIHSYADETGRQLTDGQYGTDEVDADLGSGRGYEWVAWRQTDPRIIFDLGSPKPVQAIRIHFNRRSDRRIEPPLRMRIFFSSDGRVVSYARTKTTDRIIFLDGRSRSVRIPTGGASARYVALEMADGDPQRWIFVDEVLFESG